MALAVCLLFDPRTDRAMRQLWRRLEDDGISTLLSHTHGLHVPHLSYAVLRQGDAAVVQEAIAALPDGGAIRLHVDALGLFRRNRAWLAPAPAEDLVLRQRAVVAALDGIGADLHKRYRPEVWVPHCTLAPRVRMDQLPALAAAVYDVLPLEATAARATVIDSSTGRHWPLPGVP